MRAGRLRHTVTLQSKSVSRDAVGGESITWSTFATVPAEVQPLSGREYVAMRQAQADVSVRVRMRYLSGVNPAMRVQHGSAVYDFLEVIDVAGRARELELLCAGDAVNV